MALARAEHELSNSQLPGCGLKTQQVESETAAPTGAAPDEQA